MLAGIERHHRHIAEPITLCQSRTKKTFDHYAANYETIFTLEAVGDDKYGILYPLVVHRGMHKEQREKFIAMRVLRWNSGLFGDDFSWRDEMSRI